MRLKEIKYNYQKVASLSLFLDPRKKNFTCKIKPLYLDYIVILILLTFLFFCLVNFIIYH